MALVVESRAVAVVTPSPLEIMDSAVLWLEVEVAAPGYMLLALHLRQPVAVGAGMVDREAAVLVVEVVPAEASIARPVLIHPQYPRTTSRWDQVVVEERAAMQ